MRLLLHPEALAEYAAAVAISTVLKVDSIAMLPSRLASLLQ